MMGTPRGSSKVVSGEASNRPHCLQGKGLFPTPCMGQKPYSYCLANLYLHLAV